MSLLESIQALGVEVWVPHAEAKTGNYFASLAPISPKQILIVITAQDQQNLQDYQELLSGILRWLKVAPESYNLAFIEQTGSSAMSFDQLLEQAQPQQILSFGVPLRLKLDSRPGIRYFETLALFLVHNNVENKRKVMNDFASFSL
jgi:hypothetical protein